MTREATSIDLELERLRRDSGSAVTTFERRRALFDPQVNELATRLMPRVRAALTEESASEVAQEWLGQARSGLASLMSGLLPGLEVREEYKVAAQKLQEELGRHLRAATIEPTDAEIDTHAHELAQCVLANWLTLLEHAKQDLPRQVLHLGSTALPETVAPDAIYEGIEAFVVPQPEVASAFMDHLAALQKSGAIIELAPELYLVFRDGQRLLAPSEQQARALVKPHEVEARPRQPQSLSSVLAAVFEILDPALSSRPALLGWISADAIDPATEKHLVLAVASAAVSGSKFYLDPDQVQVSTDLARCTMFNLDQALESRPRWNVDAVARSSQRLAAEAQPLIDDAGMETLHRVTLAATGYAMACPMADFGPIAFDQQLVNDYVDSSAPARAIFKLSVGATKQAVNMPRASAVGEQMKARVKSNLGGPGIDPLAF